MSLIAIMSLLPITTALLILGASSLDAAIPSISVSFYDVSVPSSLFLSSDGNVWGIGYGYGSPDDDFPFAYTPIPVASDIKAAQFFSDGAGGSHSLLLKNDGTAWYYHDGSMTQVMSDVKAISAGSDEFLLLTTGGDAWFVGISPEDNSLFLPALKVMNNVKAIYDGNIPLFLTSDGNAWSVNLSFDENVNLHASPPVKILGDVKAIYDGSVPLFLTTSGDAWRVDVTNSDAYYLQVSGPAVKVMSGVKAIYEEQWAAPVLIDDNSDAWSMEVSYGDEDYLQVSAPVKILSGVRAVSMSQWGGDLMFLKNDGSVWGSGINIGGELGIGWANDQPYTNDHSVTTPVFIMNDVKAVSVNEDFGYSLFLKNDGSVWAAGSNDDGELGDGTKDNHYTPVQVATEVEAVYASSSFGLILKTDGSVWSTGGWGLDPDTPPSLGFTRLMSLSSDSNLTWQAQFGPQAPDDSISGWLADPDGDGIPNLLERAFNLSPSQSSHPILPASAGTSGLPLIRNSKSGSNNVLTIQYIRLKSSAASGLVYTPEATSSITANTTWTAVTGTPTVESIDANWERVTIQDTTPGAQSTRFARVRVTLP